jgi:hypothetical protein
MVVMEVAGIEKKRMHRAMMLRRLLLLLLPMHQ